MENLRTHAVKAIMNNKGVGLPAAIRIYDDMTDAERREEIKNYLSYGGSFKL